MMDLTEAEQRYFDEGGDLSGASTVYWRDL